MSAPFRLAAAALLVFTAAAHAQSMTPMRGQVNSFSDEFALKVYPQNVYDHPIDFEVKAYDQNFRPVPAMIWPDRFRVGPGASRPVTVLMSFEGKQERKVRICAESVPVRTMQNEIRARICGRFLARHLH